MDVAEFNGWLSAIAALTPSQRRQAWQTLALSGASACDDIETAPPRGVEIASSAPAYRARRAREAANRPSAGFPPNRFLFSWRGTIMVRPPMRGCRNRT